MTKSVVLLLFVCFFGILFSAAAHQKPLKILIVNPTLGYSHLQFNGAIADALVAAGHTVHLFIPDWFPVLKMNGSTKAQKITRYSPSNVPMIRHTNMARYPFQYKQLDMKEFVNATLQFCNDILSDEGLIQQLKAEKYDVAVAEFLDYCIPGIFEVLGIQTKIFTEATVMLASLTTNWGIPSYDSFIPNPMKAPLSTPHFSYLERARNIIQNIIFRQKTVQFADYTTAKFRAKYGEQFPDLKEVVRNFSFAFVNSHEALELPRPTTHKVVNIGGINLRKPEDELSQEMMEIFERAKEGVILFSLGSIVNTTLMPAHQKASILEAFKQFPDYHFLWKVDGTDVIYESRRNFTNIHPFTWVDQTTLLNDKRLKLFMSHCGQNSLTEAAYSGKPVLAVPIFADQQYNAAIVKQHGVGEILEFDKITTEGMIAALDKMLTFNRYQRRAGELKKKLLTHPRGDPRDIVVRYVEYAAANPDLTNFNLLSTKMDFITLHCLDIIVPAVVVGVLMLVVVCKLVFMLVQMLQRLLADRVKAKCD